MDHCTTAWIFTDLMHAQKGPISFAANPGGIGKHGGCCTFFHNELQKQILASQNGTRVPAVHCFTVGNLGFYEFTRMPFRLCNTPGTFQCLMQNTLGELNLTYCIIYLDDVIVLWHAEEEYLEHLCIMFECFREFNLKLKPSKSSFSQRSSTWCIMYPMKGSAPAGKMCM